MKKIFLSSVALLSAVALAGCSSSENVATTSNGEITKDELYEAMKTSVGEATLQQLILTDVLNDAVGENDFASEAEAEVATTMSSYGGEEVFNYVLQQSGFANADDYEQTLYLNKLTEEAVRQNTEFTDDEIAAYYETYQPQINTQQILVEDEETAKDLIQQINDGADFAELAKENSIDTATAENGGETGMFGKGDMVTEYEEAAYALEVGEMTQEPVQSSYGYHIIKKIDEEEKGTLEEEHDTIVEEMMQEKLSDTTYVNEVISTIVQDADVSISDEDLSTAIDQFLPAEETEESSDSAAASSDATSESATSDSAATEESTSEESSSAASSSEEAADSSSDAASSESAE